MDPSRYIDLFVEEARDCIETLQREIPALADAPGDEERLFEVFRRAHTLKGSAATVGLGAIAELAHALEDVLDACRRGERTFSPQWSEQLVRAVDHLDALVSGVERDRRCPQRAGSWPERLRALLVAPPPAATPAAEATPTDEGADGGADAAPPAGPTLVVHVAAGAVMPAVRALIAVRRVAAMDALVDCRPPIAELEAGRLDAPPRLELRPDADLDRIVAAVERLPDIDRVEAIEPPPAPPSALVPATTRVASGRLDRFLDLLIELIVSHGRTERLVERMNAPGLGASLRDHRRGLDELRDLVMELRLLPFAAVAERLQGACRTTADALDKRVAVEIEGGEVALDRALLERIAEPLLHMVRNAVDHGVETPQRRRELGKTPTATVRIGAARDGDAVRVWVADDGAGIDLEALRRHAVDSGLLSAERAATLERDALLDLVTRPGFTTTEAVGPVSGRGVGMDVARHRTEALGGRLHIATTPGAGTRVELVLPPALALLRALVVAVGEAIFALPATAIRRILEVAPDQYRRVARRSVLPDRTPLFDLGALLERAPQPVGLEATRPAVLLGRGDDRAALVVGRVLEQRELVVKPLGSPLDRIPHYSGAAVLDEGRLALVLDPWRLVPRRHAQEVD